MITACININRELFKTFKDAAYKAGIGKNQMAHLLFCRAMNKQKLLKIKIFCRVSYQRADPSKQWEKVKIKLADDMFEKCHDMRKMLKISVSCIFADAIRSYLDEIVKELINDNVGSSKASKKDNYSHYYSITSLFQDYMDGFQVKWSTRTNTIYQKL